MFSISKTVRRFGRPSLAAASSFRAPHLKRFASDTRGVTMIEFAIVVMPFFLLFFGTIILSFFYFNQVSVERGMDDASRLIRTGEAQQLNMTVAQFKDRLCKAANSREATDPSSAGWIKCDKLEVFMQQSATWANVRNLQPCVSPSGAALTNAAPGGTPIANIAGSASTIVVVTVCYKWELTKDIKLIPIGNMNDNSTMMQAVTAFRSEPYDVN